jgi:hypothetical protein
VGLLLLLLGSSTHVYRPCWIIRLKENSHTAA